MPQEVMNIIWSALGIIVTGFISWGVAKAIKYFDKKFEDRRISSFLGKATTIVGDAVKVVYQDFVEALKDDGKFDAEEQKAAKEKALSIIDSQLTPELKDFIKEYFGIEVPAWISNQIEVAIYNFKK